MLDYSRNPEIIGRIRKKLRKYQIAAVARGAKSRNILLDMYMGLGKTICTWTIVLSHRPRHVIFICGQNAQSAWIKDLRNWAPEYAIPEEFTIVAGKGSAVKARQQREACWQRRSTFFVCTMETFLADYKYIVQLGMRIDFIVVDEAHKIPQHTTKTFKAFKDAVLSLRAYGTGLIMQTGTWVKRDASRGWRHLHLLNPQRFSSFWKFRSRYCLTVDNGFGSTVVGAQNVQEFHHIISPYVFRFHEIDGHIPKAARKMMWINLDNEQRHIYDKLSEDMLVMLENGTLVISKASITTFMKHRQLLACPKLIDPSLGFGAGFRSVLTLLEDYADDPEEQHCVIFSPFRDALDYFAAELNRRGYATFIFRGGVRGSEILEREVGFRSMVGKKSVALCTIDFAESYHLGTAIRSHFIGLHHDGDPMKQAEARLARADSDLSKTILHRYWVHSDSIDERRVSVIEGRASVVRELFSHVDEVRRELLGQ